MSEMVERVARAIAAADDEDYMEDCRRYDKRSRAAIEAMREPTEAMISARFNVLGQGGEKEWLAMIDAALTTS